MKTVKYGVTVLIYARGCQGARPIGVGTGGLVVRTRGAPPLKLCPPHGILAYFSAWNRKNVSLD